MRTIVFAGNLGCGKTTAAERVTAIHGFTQVSFADPLKRLGDSAFTFTFDQLWGPSGFRNAADSRYHPVFGTTPEQTHSEEWHWAMDRLSVEGQPWIQDNILEFTNKIDKAEAFEQLKDWFEWLRKEHPSLSPRVMLQTLGTEYGRQALYEDIWVDIGLETSRRLLSGVVTSDELCAINYVERFGLLYGAPSKWVGKGIVIPDARFPNELRAVKAAGGQVWRIYRPETDDKAATIGVAGHASENSLDSIPASEYSGIINNDGTLEEFYEAIDIAAGITMSAG